MRSVSLVGEEKVIKMMLGLPSAVEDPTTDIGRVDHIDVMIEGTALSNISNFIAYLTHAGLELEWEALIANGMVILVDMEDVIDSMAEEQCIQVPILIQASILVKDFILHLTPISTLMLTIPMNPVYPHPI